MASLSVTHVNKWIYNVRNSSESRDRRQEWKQQLGGLGQSLSPKSCDNTPQQPAIKQYRPMLYDSSLAAHKLDQQTTYITKQRYSH